jgi:hypothetical protein
VSATTNPQTAALLCRSKRVSDTFWKTAKISWLLFRQTTPSDCFGYEDDLEIMGF